MLRNATKSVHVADARRVQPSPAEWVLISERWGFSARESAVVKLLVCGWTRKEAAHDLEISISTLQTHLRRALWKARSDDLIALIWGVVAQLQRLRG